MTQDLFDLSRLKLRPLAERQHDLDLSVICEPGLPSLVDPAFEAVARRLVSARERGAARILMMGAHVLRSGVQRHLFELMQAGLISHIAVNGACLIHDFEFALIGATTESVARYIKTGEFGLWTETGRINDIVHEHPNCDGAAWGAASYRDFLRFARAVENLEGGAVMNFGSAVMGPEVYLKALAMARNVAAQENRKITDFTVLVCDLADLPRESLGADAPKTDPRYFFRPWKTMLVRTVADGGQSHYVAGRHAETIPQLWAACLALGQD